MSQVTAPILLDSTGQDISAKLQAIANAINGGTIDPLTVTQNGTYTPSGTTLGYGPVTVNVGGGGGVVLSGTDAPSASVGNNEDLYIQYEICSPPLDHTYKIAGQFRKVEGSWVAYTEPVAATDGIHVWTKSTGGNDAAMWVQHGYWDTNTQQYVPTDEPVSYVYTDVRAGVDLYGLVNLIYGGMSWTLTALKTLTDGVNTYPANTSVATWVYNVTKDITVWTPVR